MILRAGAAGRLGLPASGYLFGTYENPTNSGDGYAMAFHAGAELANLECFQINPLIKDYNGPACAYVGGPFGGYTANSRGARFIECDYWTGQMMLEFRKELEGGNGPVFLKFDHLADETISEVESILHSVERPSRGLFHEGRGNNYRRDMVEMHISEIGFCSGHSASGVWVDEHARTTVPGLYAAGDMASVPHNYMLGAFVNGAIAGEDAAASRGARELRPTILMMSKRNARACAALDNEDGLPANQVEYKIRRFVNDYLQPPKVTRKMRSRSSASPKSARICTRIVARDPHELMRALEVHSILDCADMAAAASLFRTESRWGLYHYRVDYPEQDDANWFCHTQLFKDEQAPSLEETPGRSLVVPLESERRGAYDRLRIPAARLRPPCPLPKTHPNFRSRSTRTKCIADKGCTVCVDVCPLDVLRIDPRDRQGAYAL